MFFEVSEVLDGEHQPRQKCKNPYIYEVSEVLDLIIRPQDTHRDARITISIVFSGALRLCCFYSSFTEVSAAWDLPRGPTNNINHYRTSEIQHTHEAT